MEKFKTIQIVDPKKKSDFLVINAKDFDPKEQTLWTERNKIKKPKPAPKVNESVPQKEEDKL